MKTSENCVNIKYRFVNKLFKKLRELFIFIMLDPVEQNIIRHSQILSRAMRQSIIWIIA